MAELLNSETPRIKSIQFGSEISAGMLNEFLCENIFQ